MNKWTNAHKWAQGLTPQNLHKRFYDSKGYPKLSQRWSMANSWRSLEPKFALLTNANKLKIIDEYLKNKEKKPERGVLRKAGRALGAAVLPTKVTALYNIGTKRRSKARTLREVITLVGPEKLHKVFNAANVNEFVKAHKEFVNNPNTRNHFIGAAFKLSSRLFKADTVTFRNFVNSVKHVHNFQTQKIHLSVDEQKKLGEHLSKVLGKLILNFTKRNRPYGPNQKNALEHVKNGAITGAVKWLPEFVASNKAHQNLLANALSFAYKESKRPMHVQEVRKHLNKAKLAFRVVGTFGQTIPMKVAKVTGRPVLGHVANAAVAHTHPVLMAQALTRAAATAAGVAKVAAVGATHAAIKAGLRSHARANVESASSKKALNNLRKLNPHLVAALNARRMNFNYSVLSPKMIERLPVANKNFIKSVRQRKVLQSFINS